MALATIGTPAFTPLNVMPAMAFVLILLSQPYFW